MPDKNNPGELFKEKLALILRSELSASSRAGSELYIYLGEPSKITMLRKQLPEKSLLLFFHPPMTEKIESDEWTLTCPFESDFEEFIWLAISCFKPDKINCAISETLSSFDNEDLTRIKKTADKALLNISNERIQRMPRLRASIQNLPKILSPRSLTFKKTSDDVPALVCGAGPSLTSQLPLIKKLSNKAVIIASGRLGKVFKDNGISPDFIVHLDPETDFDALLPEMPGSTLIAVPGTSPAVTAKFEKIIWTQGDSIFFNRFLRDNNISLHGLSISMTSTVTAIDLALKLGCGNIMLAGNDLCLSRHGTSHVKGYQSSAYQGKLLEIDGNNGKKVATLKEINILRIAIEDFLSSIKNEDVRFFNCALKGAAIKNASKMSLKDFAAEFANSEIKKELTQEWNPGFSSPNMDKIKRLLKEFASFTNEKIKCLEDILKHKDNPAIVSGLNKGLSLLENKIIEISIEKEIKHFVEAINETSRDIFRNVSEMPLKSSKFILNLCADLLKDLEWDRTPESRPHTRIFESFKNFAVDFIEQNNKEFADALKNEAFKKEEADCDLHLRGIAIPPATVCGCKLLDNEDTGKKEVEAFAGQTGFNASESAVVIIDPGNWHCATEFAKKYPDADLIIAEPRPALFSKLTKYCAFIHLFSERTLFLGIHESLKNWEGIYREKLKSLKAQGKNIVFFKPSSTWKLPETQKLFEEHFQDL